MVVRYILTWLTKTCQFHQCLDCKKVQLYEDYIFPLLYSYVYYGTEEDLIFISGLFSYSVFDTDWDGSAYSTSYYYGWTGRTMLTC